MSISPNAALVLFYQTISHITKGTFHHSINLECWLLTFLLLGIFPVWTSWSTRRLKWIKTSNIIIAAFHWVLINIVWSIDIFYGHTWCHRETELHWNDMKQQKYQLRKSDGNSHTKQHCNYNFLASEPEICESCVVLIFEFS